MLLHSLERDGFVTRPAAPSVGRVLPAQLTPLERQRLAKASAVRSVEIGMLRSMIDALGSSDEHDPERHHRPRHDAPT